jgi:hypothetical protein
MFEGLGEAFLFAFDATVRGHVDIIDFLQRGFGSFARLKQFCAKSHNIHLPLGHSNPSTRCPIVGKVLGASFGDQS